MAVYKRGYEPYEGRLTPDWTRFLVIARYAYRGLFDSKLLVTFFVVCFIAPVVAAVWIYLPHNAAVKEIFNPHRYMAIDGTFFFRYLQQQATFAFLLTAFIGPGLVSADLVNNALPLYFCRAFNRTEYLVGKAAVLAILLSTITWIPGLLLFAFQTGLVGFQWAIDNWHIAWALFAGSWVWIFLLCLLALSASALVRRRVIAGGVILGIFFVPAGFGAAINEAVKTTGGDIMNIVTVLARIWTEMFRIDAQTRITEEAAWLGFAAACWLCIVLLKRKVKAYEVVK